MVRVDDQQNVKNIDFKEINKIAQHTNALDKKKHRLTSSCNLKKVS